MEQKIGVVIQARTGSTRLPHKTVKNFYKGKTILDIIIENIKASELNLPIIVATTIKKEDDEIVNVADRQGVACYRGDEEDVLQRFLDVIDKYSFEAVVRVCADNPFYDVQYHDQLLREFINGKRENVDYLSYIDFTSVPVIRTHYGFFGEVVSSQSLKRVARLTREKIYREHVTNFIYSHTDLFKVKFLSLPNILKDKGYIRTTIDDEVDFRLIQMLYNELVAKRLDVNLKNVVELVDSKSDYKKLMIRQIQKYKK